MSELLVPHPNIMSGVDMGHHLPRESQIIRHSEPKRETRPDLPAVLYQVPFVRFCCSPAQVEAGPKTSALNLFGSGGL